jgi:REP element-mobilizing transposase RayT
MSKLKEIIHQYVVEALEEILSEEVEQISEMNYQDDKWKLLKTYPAQSPNHYTAKVYKNITSRHYRSNEPYHVQAIDKNGKVYEPAEYFADDEEEAHGNAREISGHPVKESADQINELSDDLLDNYKRKARKAINKLAPPMFLPPNPDSPRGKQLEKRVKGYRLAWDKLGRK